MGFLSQVTGLKCLKDAAKYPKGLGVAWVQALRLHAAGFVVDHHDSDACKIIDSVFISCVLPHVPKLQAAGLIASTVYAVSSDEEHLVSAPHELCGPDESSEDGEVLSVYPSSC